MLAALVAGCASSAPAERAAEKPADYIACPSQRPQICTQEYVPVCALRDTGVRCVKAPCPSAEEVTKASACSACSDASVLGYRPGACR